jgi:hypothetical protein
MFMVLLGGRYRGTFFRFPYNPATYKIGGTANYADHNIPGRSHPIQHWTHGSNRTISFQLPLEAKSDIIYAKNVGVSYAPIGEVEPVVMTEQLDGARKLVQCYNFLESLRYPRIFLDDPNSDVGDVNFGPPTFLLVLANNMRYQCVMRSVEMTVKEMQPITNIPIRVEIDLSMTEVVDFSVTHEDQMIRGDRRALLAPGA